MQKSLDALVQKIGTESRKGVAEDPSCPACTTAQAAGALFCPQCGRSFLQAAGGDSTDVPEAIEPSQVNDPEPSQTVAEIPAKLPACQCGQDLSEDSVFCHRCGSKVGDGLPCYRLAILGDKVKHVHLGEEAIIGKDPECDIAMPDDGFVSRRHARISHSDSTFLLEDLGSANGTLLRIRRSIMLEVGDEIVVGKTVLRLEPVGSNRPGGSA